MPKITTSHYHPSLRGGTYAYGSKEDCKQCKGEAEKSKARREYIESIKCACGTLVASGGQCKACEEVHSPQPKEAVTLTVDQHPYFGYQAYVADEVDVDGCRSGHGKTPEDARQDFHELHDTVDADPIEQIATRFAVLFAVACCLAYVLGFGSGVAGI